MFQSGIGFNDYKPTKIWKKRKKYQQFIVDETLIKVGNQIIWLWIAIEPVKVRSILDIRISLERSMLIAEPISSKFD